VCLSFRFSSDFAGAAYPASSPFAGGCVQGILFLALEDESMIGVSQVMEYPYWKGREFICWLTALPTLSQA